jgi:hypothetical protein
MIASMGSLLGHALVPLALVSIIVAFSLVSQHFRLKWAFIIAARVTVGEAATEAVIETLQNFAVLFFPRLWRQDQSRLEKLRQLKNVLRDTSFAHNAVQNMLSATAFVLVILPILVVPFTLHLDKSPATHDPRRSEAARQPEPMLGVTRKSVRGVQHHRFLRGDFAGEEHGDEGVGVPHGVVRRVHRPS